LLRPTFADFFPPQQISLHLKGGTMNQAIVLLLGMLAILEVTFPLHADAADRESFIQKNCIECHDAATKEGGLDLTSLKFNLVEPDNFNNWARIHDRVAKGEMPPPDSQRPTAAELEGFVNDLSTPLIAADRERIAKEGRSTRRRMNRYEYENTLRDLLGIPVLEVRDFLPEDNQISGFNKVGDGLDVSHVQMARYLKAADFALRNALSPQSDPIEATTTRYYAWDQRGFPKGAGPTIRMTFKMLGYELQARSGRRGGANVATPTPPAPSPEVTHDREKESYVIVTSTYEPAEIQFNSFRAPVTARYKLKFSAFSMWMSTDFTKASVGHCSEPMTVYSDRNPSLFRRLGSFDVGVEPTINEIDVWLITGETIRPDAARLVRCRPPEFKNPLAEADGMPGMAFQWMEVEGPLFDQWPPPGHKVMFGDMPIVNRPTVEPVDRGDRGDRGDRAERGGRRGAVDFSPKVEVVSNNHEADSEVLMRRFMERVYQNPPREVDVQRFLRVYKNALGEGYNFTDAMIASYTGVLSSPAFIYFDEKPGRLPGRALADRLAFMLWNSTPDEELLQLAASGELQNPDVLRQQTQRLLDHSKSRQFVNAFLDYWLDLRLIEATSPDTFMYPDYELDDLLVESQLEETQLFFSELLKRNLPSSSLISSDFAVINERLADLYEISGVEGTVLRPVSLPIDSIRGGLLTQGAVLKITANGTTTSPVIRGGWIMSRLLGQPPPPPPEKVPVIEADIRGATTIREQLAKHRSDALCNSCHRNIDPVGFALEGFDVMGARRERYRAMTDEGSAVKGIGHNGQRYTHRDGLPVDSSGQLPDGREFSDVRQLKQCLLENQEQVARNLLQQLIVYSTGSPIQFSDRPVVAKILERTKADGYPVRSLVHEIVQSDLFLNK